MKRVISILAFTWASLTPFIILGTYIGIPKLGEASRKLPFMKINPLFTGGDLNYSLEKDSLKISINKPVFEALIGESEEGFVQVTFSGTDSLPLPSIIDQEIDYNNDTKPDFKLKINTLENKTAFFSLNPNVKSLEVSSKVKNNWLVRVKVKNINNQ